jgi:hypothetical protein
MREKQLRTLLPALCGLLIAAPASGCQYSYPFAIRGTILTVADGSPLAGVRVVLKAPCVTIVGPGTEETPALTGNGKFLLTFEAPEVCFTDTGSRSQWSLNLSKEGYTDEVIDVSPGQEPSRSGGGRTQIIVVAFMRPKAHQ